MTDTYADESAATAGWLGTYSFVRFAFSALWVVLALTLGRGNPAVAAGLLVIYPAWDALANFVDARRNGGFGRNRTQYVNAIVSAVTTAAVAWALTLNMFAVIVVFGVWAAVSGVLQLVTGLRRWGAGGQWVMVLSGAQSTLAGLFFLMTVGGMPDPGIAIVAGYAAFGAVYFLVSAIWLTVKRMRGR